jgi:dihydroorotate dehydrogenase
MEKNHSRLGIAAGLIKSRLHVPRGTIPLLHHVTFGSFTREARQGNKEPTYWYDEATRSSINAVGLTNRGLGHFVENDLTALYMEMANMAELRVSLAPLKADDVKEMLATHGHLLVEMADEIELNAACPNHRGGDGALHPVLCCDKNALEELMSEASDYPGAKAIKIAPGMSEEDLATVVKLAVAYKFSSIVSGNTRKASSVIDGTQRLSVDQGGMAGATLLEDGLEQVRTLNKIISNGGTPDHIRLIACGGVMSANDMQAYLDAGAEVVQCATYFAQYGEKGIRDLMTDWVAAS